MNNKLVLPEDIKTLLRELPPAQNVSIPPTWNNIVVVSNTLRCFYASISKTPVEYEHSIRKRLNPRWTNTALCLRSLVEKDNDFQFFVLHRLARPEVEHWLNSLGYCRITTRMGEGANPVSVCFKVYSKENDLIRYVSAPIDTPEEEIIEKANKGLALWLASPSNAKTALRKAIRIATRSAPHKVNKHVFESTSVVTKTTLFNKVHTTDYRSIVRDQNFKALEAFVFNTTF